MNNELHKVAVIIVSYNVRTFLDLCLDSVFRALQNTQSEVFVVDNNSIDGSCEMIQVRYPQVHLIQNKENAGFAKANNQAVALSNAQYIHFLNPDTVLPEDFYEKSLAFMDQHPEAGALGPKLIDGKGKFSLDSKRSFPSFWPSIYRLTKLSNLFKTNSKFNRYYRLDIHEDQTAPVEILSGCCVLIRKEAMNKSGGSFDETYFMFCEDIDLCHRIGLAGYKNYYFPKVTVVHYKGESTRKLTVSYMKMFYKVHKIFVRKYYPPKIAEFYIRGLGLVLGIRNGLYIIKHFFPLFKLFLFDGIVLGAVFLWITNFWFSHVIKQMAPTFLQSLPNLSFFLLCWLGSLFLNGAYDKPFSLFKAGRGMIVGTLLGLAGYALFSPDYRFSRAAVLLSGMTGFILILALRWFTSLFGWIRLLPKGSLAYKTALVSDEAHFNKTLMVLKNRPYYAEIIGRIAPETDMDPIGDEVLGSERDIFIIQQQFKINEIIFNGASTSYKRIIQLMQTCGRDSFLKIQASKSLTFVGSNSIINNAELYFTNRKYELDTPSARRNKRILDLVVSTIILILFPIFKTRSQYGQNLLRNVCKILKGEWTWVGYDDDLIQKGLPHIQTSVLPTFKIVDGYHPNERNLLRLAEFYAQNYTPLNDLNSILQNLKYIGK